MSRIRELYQSRVAVLATVFVMSAAASGMTAAVLAMPAGAFQDYTSTTEYKSGWQAAGTTDFTNGWNYRTENDTCRSDNSGQRSVQYINTNNVYVSNSGPYYTHCWDVLVVLLNNGYYKASCYNAGTVSHYAECVAYNYQP